ncbi:hypothetical protein Q1695_004510 [Nippostrongylus brasiliensis]|nr:hypothetical protein Q1695_004510 [Nippostrongylus brasiliensis]
MLFVLVAVLGVWSSQIPVVAAGLLRTDEAFARLKRSDVVEQKSPSRFLVVIQSYLVNATKSEEARTDPKLKTVLDEALNSLLQFARQEDDDRKLHVTLRVLTQTYSLRDSLLAAIKERPGSSYVLNVVGALYWICQSITTYVFTDVNYVKTLVKPLSVYNPTEHTLNETLKITLQVIEELLEYFKEEYPQYFKD